MTPAAPEGVGAAPDQHGADAGVSLHRKRRSQRPARKPADARPAFPGLAFHLPTPYPRPALVDLSSFSRPVLAEQVARMVFVDHHDGVAFRSHGAIGEAMETMRRFDEFLAGHDPGKRVASLMDVRPGDVDAFDGWAHGGRWPVGSVVPFTHLATLVLLLTKAVEHGFAGAALEARLTHVSKRNGPVASSPRDAYSEHVMAQVRQGARSAVRRTVLRMARARRVARGKAVGGRFERADDIVAALAADTFPSDLDSLDAMLKRQGLPTLAKLLDRLHPGLPDLVPFAILIACDCGLPPECIQELGADCLTEVETGFGLGTLKHKKRRREGTEELYSEPVKTRVRWSTGWLVRLLLAVTATTRRQMPADAGRDRLFVGRAGAGLKSLHLNQHAIDAHLARHPVEEADGEPLGKLNLGRIRKSVKARRYADAGGDLAGIGDDHRRETFAVRYAAIPALAGTHEKSIENALWRGLEDALLSAAPEGAVPPEQARAPRSVVLDEAAEAAARSDPAAAALGIGRGEDQLRRALGAEAEVWLAGCLDFDRSPFPKAGGGLGCGAPLWGCLDCANAVITASKVPSLLRLLGHLRQKRGEMTLVDFARHFGLAFLRVQQILSRFPGEVVRSAASEVEDGIGEDWFVAQLTYKLV